MTEPAFTSALGSREETMSASFAAWAFARASASGSPLRSGTVVCTTSTFFGKMSKRWMAYTEPTETTADVRIEIKTTVEPCMEDRGFA